MSLIVSIVLKGPAAPLTTLTRNRPLLLDVIQALAWLGAIYFALAVLSFAFVRVLLAIGLTDR